MESEKIYSPKNSILKKTKFQDNHSIISNFPVKENEYKLIKRVKFVEVILRKNDYLLIPKGCFHWVLTEKDTVALTYNLDNFESENDKNPLVRSIKNGILFKNRNTRYDLDFDEIKEKIKNEKYYIMYNLNKHLPPVKKPFNNNSEIRETNLKEEKDMIEKDVKYSYGIISSDRFNIKYFKEIPNFCDIKDISKFDYDIFLWLSFNKEVDSGLHYDSKDNIIYILSGEKKVYLCNNNNYNNLYITKMSTI